MPMKNASNCQKRKCLTLLHVVDTINWRSMLRMVVLKEIVKSMLRKLKACNGEITKLKARKAYRESLKHAMEKLQSYATIQLRSISMPLCKCIEKHEKHAIVLRSMQLCTFSLFYWVHGLESEFLKVIFLQLRSM